MQTIDRPLIQWFTFADSADAVKAPVDPVARADALLSIGTQ
jgi:hypothetical protein